VLAIRVAMNGTFPMFAVTVVELVKAAPAVGVPTPSEAPVALDDEEKPDALLQLTLTKDFATSTALIVAVPGSPAPLLCKAKDIDPL
tara:strand:+ start:659 stop:919 length:261 start_codon:yes stop_codon:yes gene_type:complete